MSHRSILAASLATAFGIKPDEADARLLTFVGALKSHLDTHGEAVLPGFGRLVNVDRPARTGRNPRTGETIEIEAKTVVKFREFPSSKA